MSDPVGPEGSVEKPFRENPPEHLRSVHWGGAEFTVGVNLRVAAPEGGSTNTIFLRGSGNGWTGSKTLAGSLTVNDNRCGAYGAPANAPTFLLAGLSTKFDSSPVGFLYTAWIEASTDAGATWVRGYEADHSFVVALVYDKEQSKFFAQAVTDAQKFPGDEDYTWIVLESRDGLSWGVVESTPGHPGVGNQYASPIMTAAADAIYQDGFNNNCPGGVYGYNKAAKILMAPYPDIVAFAYEGKFGSPQVQIRSEDETGYRAYRYIDIPGMESVVSVAYAGGIWQAAGFSSDDTAVIATSKNVGTTWDITYSQAGPGGTSARIVLGRGA